ncbi:MAG: glycosyltransferase family 2 protein [Bryobacteraceae bacterium]
MPIEVRHTVAAIVPHWNRRDLLPAFFDSLHKQQRQFDEVILVDNGSSDDSATLAESFGARVIRLEKNLGFAAAVNRGMEAADTDWVAIVNNDITFHASWLDQLLTRAIAAGSFFATGKTLDASDHSRIDGTYDEISRGACALRCGAGKFDRPFWNREKTIRFAPMTAALFRRELLTELGGLDESFESYLEDVDFGIRCALAGKPGLYVPSAIAYHRGSSTLGRWSADTVRYIARNQVLLAAKYLQGQPRFPILAGQLLWGLVAAKHGCGGAFREGRRAGKLAAGNVRPRTVEERSRLAAVFAESEKEIFAVQEQTGFDAYWRAYSWLAR